MDYKEIIKLLDAGYTRDEIINFENEQANDEKSIIDENSETENDSNLFSELKDMFEELKNEIIASNILASQRTDTNNKNDVEKIIANVISPNNEIKEEKE